MEKIELHPGQDAVVTENDTTATPAEAAQEKMVLRTENLVKKYGSRTVVNEKCAKSSRKFRRFDARTEPGKPRPFI